MNAVTLLRQHRSSLIEEVERIEQAITILNGGHSRGGTRHMTVAAKARISNGVKQAWKRRKRNEE